MDDKTKQNEKDFLQGPVIKVLGLGGGGSNAVDRMIELGIDGVEFLVANTDHQSLMLAKAGTKIQLGPKLTRGLGAGGNSETGRAAAEESQADLEEALRGADMVFLTAGMGGGTGTGSISVAADAARAVGALSIAIVTTPFGFEMGGRQKNSQHGLATLQPKVDTLIAIPNDRLLYVAAPELPLDLAFRMADDVLRQSVQGIAELITQPGIMNVDFSHVKNLMSRGGGAIMAIGQGEGEHKTQSAIQQALNHPLLESISLQDASGVIAHFSGGQDLSLHEVGDAFGQIREETGSQVDVVMGLSSKDEMEGKAQVILVVTGLGAKNDSETEIEPAISQDVEQVAELAVSEPSIDEEVMVAETVILNETESSEIKETLEDTEPAITRINLDDELPAAALNNLDIPAFLRKKAKLNLASELSA
jgi:cell division protein FtsZ